MPAKPNKKKPMPIILENRLNGSNTVQMAQHLYLQLRNANLSLIELKLIDVYLSRINSHNPDAREVVFNKGELEKLFGVTRIQNDALNNHFDKLMQISVIVTSEEEDDDTFTTRKNSFTLFNKAILAQDKKDGLWQVRMKCGDEAAALIFNIDKIGYLQHTVRDTARMSNLNSFLVYKFIESRRMNKSSYPQTFIISLEDLRAQLNCVNKYKSFRDFNKYVLKAAQNEIHERTAARFDYETIYSGRNVAKIKFIIWDKLSQNDKALPVIDAPAALPSFDDADIPEAPPKPQRYYYGNSYDLYESTKSEDSENSDISDELVAMLAASCKNEFSPSQMRTIISLLLYYSRDERELFEYLEKKYFKFEMKSEETQIMNRFKYFYTMIENDKEQGVLDETFNLIGSII